MQMPSSYETLKQCFYHKHTSTNAHTNRAGADWTKTEKVGMEHKEKTPADYCEFAQRSSSVAAKLGQG